MPEYINALRYMGRRDYEKALDNLQRLVVQRLFELHKMNQSMNGMQSIYFLDHKLFHELFRLSNAHTYCQSTSKA